MKPERAAMNTRWTILRAGIKEFFAFRKFLGLKEDQRSHSSAPNDFVETILSLGPTFVKLGQILSTRPDLLPEHYIAALARLQENTPPFAYDEVKRIVEQELGKPLGEAFAEFDPEPVASASLAQVHFGVLPGGEEVAVKIQRPALKGTIERDLAILEQLLFVVKLANRRLFDNLNISAVFAEFKRYTLEEIDFAAEGATYDQFRANFDGDDAVRFPTIYWSHTTPKLLTMSRESGLRLNEAAEHIPAAKKARLNETVIRALIQMFVRDGFFHADLHPGNIFFHEDGSIVLLDVGMVGRLSDEQKERFILYWLAIVLKEKERAFRHLVQLTRPSAKADRDGFFTTYSALLDEFYSATIREKSLTRTYLEILIAGARHGFRFPSEMLLQAKALTTAEHIGYVLTPDFNFAETAKSYVTNALAERLSADNIRDRLSRSLPEWLLLGENAGRSLLAENARESEIWTSGSARIAQRWDKVHGGDYEEVRHGEASVIVEKDVAPVFNFVTRFAQYPLWHPVYTGASHVIHVSGEYIFILPGAVGPVFRLDEIVDGYHLLSNGVVTEFERNRLFKWKAPFSMLPAIELGTCIEFESAGPGRTRLSEYFYFSESPMMHVFVNREWFTADALTQHIREELTGVKHLMESNDYVKEDVEYLWENINAPVRFIGEKRAPIHYHQNS